MQSQANLKKKQDKKAELLYFWTKMFTKVNREKSPEISNQFSRRKDVKSSFRDDI